MALDDAAHHDPAQCGDSFTERIDAAEKHGKVRYRKVADKPSVAYLNVVAISDRVLGCHMVGPEAGEIIQGLAVALNCGATKAQFDATIGIHPTAAEEFVTMRTKIA